jgi:hypothetical protein
MDLSEPPPTTTKRYRYFADSGLSTWIWRKLPKQFYSHYRCVFSPYPSVELLIKVLWYICEAEEGPFFVHDKSFAALKGSQSINLHNRYPFSDFLREHTYWATELVPVRDLKSFQLRPSEFPQLESSNPPPAHPVSFVTAWQLTENRRHLASLRQARLASEAKAASIIATKGGLTLVNKVVTDHKPTPDVAPQFNNCGSDHESDTSCDSFDYSDQSRVRHHRLSTEREIALQSDLFEHSTAQVLRQWLTDGSKARALPSH